MGLTWSDCGGAHGTTKSVEPSTIQLGDTTHIALRFPSQSCCHNHDCCSSRNSCSHLVRLWWSSRDNKICRTYDMHMTAGGGLINKHFTGNNCEAKDFDLPLGLGTLSWAGIECPLAAGDTELHFTTKLAAALPASLAKSDISMQALDQDG